MVYRDVSSISNIDSLLKLVEYQAVASKILQCDKRANLSHFRRNTGAISSPLTATAVHAANTVG